MLAVVPAALAGERVDRAVCMLTGVSRSAAAELVSLGAVRIDGAVVLQRSRKVYEHERLEVSDRELEETRHPSQASVPTEAEGEHGGVSFTVIFEDDQLIVVDKPPGLVVHHGAGH